MKEQTALWKRGNKAVGGKVGEMFRAGLGRTKNIVSLKYLVEFSSNPLLKKENQEVSKQGKHLSEITLKLKQKIII